MKNYLYILAILSCSLLSCQEKKSAEVEQSAVVSVKTTFIKQGDIAKNINLNGKTVYLKKSSIVSPITGYVTKIYINFGDNVKKNEVLFEIQTKENKALQQVDTSIMKKSSLKVLATADGIIEELNINQAGAFVSEGNNLCNIVENEDLMIQLNSPFEYNNLVKPGTSCQILLADKSKIDGSVYKVMPIVNAVSQTQNILIKPHSNRQIPENLNVTVLINGPVHKNTLLLPKAAVLNNELQNDFWVMKIAENSLAAKISVSKGYENDSLIEIVTTALKLGDEVIIDGAYGLADSTKVKILK